jgi:hypothetical protein
MLSVRSIRLYGADSVCLSAAKPTKSTTRIDVADSLDAHEADELGLWMDDSVWTDDNFSDEQTLIFADDAEDEIGEEDGYSYDYDDDDDEYQAFTTRKPMSKPKRVKSNILDEDEMDDDELAEYLTWR